MLFFLCFSWLFCLWAFHICFTVGQKSTSSWIGPQGVYFFSFVALIYSLGLGNLVGIREQLPCTLSLLYIKKKGIRTKCAYKYETIWVQLFFPTILIMSSFGNLCSRFGQPPICQQSCFYLQSNALYRWLKRKVHSQTSYK